MKRRMQVLTLTDAAAERVRSAMERAEKPVYGLRVGIKKGGCAGMSYTVDYADAPEPLDEIIEDKGARVLVDPKALLFLLGTEMDVKTDRFSSTFVFNNPNETAACGCGESVSLKPAEPSVSDPA